MPIDHAIALTANPGVFIGNHGIGLSEIDANMGVGGIPALNDMTCILTLSQASANGLPAPNSMPMLRMCPGMGGGGLTTILAKYCRAGDGGTHVDQIPYVDFRAALGVGEPPFLFTVGQNGCSFIVVSAVPGTAPALAPLHLRLLHDHSHYSLAHWQAAGYTVRFAAYSDGVEPGPIPGAFAANINVVNYNPNNYPWFFVVGGVARARVTTNFLHWNGANWDFHSKHFHDSGGVAYDVDVPPGAPPPAAVSTQSLAM